MALGGPCLPAVTNCTLLLHKLYHIPEELRTAAVLWNRDSSSRGLLEINIALQPEELIYLQIRANTAKAFALLVLIKSDKLICITAV